MPRAPGARRLPAGPYIRRPEPGHMENCSKSKHNCSQLQKITHPDKYSIKAEKMHGLKENREKNRRRTGGRGGKKTGMEAEEGRGEKKRKRKRRKGRTEGSVKGRESRKRSGRKEDIRV